MHTVVYWSGSAHSSWIRRCLWHFKECSVNQLAVLFHDNQLLLWIEYFTTVAVFGLPKYRTLSTFLLYRKDKVFRKEEYKHLKLFRAPIFSKVLKYWFQAFLGLQYRNNKHHCLHFSLLKTLRHPWLWRLWHFSKDS